MQTPPIDLSHFVQAQDRVYPAVLAELRAGAKRSHWMWFVFPQIVGLGHSAAARHYAIRSIAEARAYLADPLLGGRLRECVAAMLANRARGAEDILGAVDAIKFRSSLTLFEQAEDDSGGEGTDGQGTGGEGTNAGEPGLFGAALDAFYDGDRDEATLRILQDG